jgi:chromosome segregation ATPase
VEIKIKTMDEFRDGRVQIELTVPREEVRELSDRLLVGSGYDPNAAANTMAENYVRARMRIDELETQIRVQHEPGGVWDRCIKAEAHVNRLRLSLAAARAELVESERRADANREWAERAETTVATKAVSITELRALLEMKDSAIESYQDDLGRSMDRFREKDAELTEASNRLAAALTQLGKVVGAVHGPEVVIAVDRALSPHSLRMAEAIRQVREAVSPYGPSMPAEDTSQA